MFFKGVVLIQMIFKFVMMSNLTQKSAYVRLNYAMINVMDAIQNLDQTISYVTNVIQKIHGVMIWMKLLNKATMQLQDVLLTNVLLQAGLITFHHYQQIFGLHRRRKAEKENEENILGRKISGQLVERQLQAPLGHISHYHALSTTSFS